MELLLLPFKILGTAFACALALVSGLTALVLGALGRALSLLIGLALAGAGAALCATVIGLVVGVPAALFGLALIIRAVF